MLRISTKNRLLIKVNNLHVFIDLKHAISNTIMAFLKCRVNCIYLKKCCFIATMKSHLRWVLEDMQEFNK